MLKRVLEKKMGKRKKETSLMVFERLLTLRFNGEKEARAALQNYAVNGVLEEKGFERLLCDLNLDKLYYIFYPLVYSDNYIQLFNALIHIKSRAKSTICSMTQTEKQSLFSFLEDLQRDKVINELIFPESKTGGPKKSLNRLLEINFTSKASIAKELNIDKKTLNKWLAVFYEDKYRDSRKIKLKDYLDIMMNFSLSETENKFSIGGDLDEYVDRLNNDLVHNRTSLLNIERLEDMNFKSLKENLKLQKIDSHVKKIPYSIKEQITDRLS
ncbi:hypothetical protein BY457_11012 [Marinilabilia salmonicolor]|jgi:hypothetical protein|uniref:hypothetical protein n=1 Tax=Marinilabilia salmonicolor TaxID=989 RepID=UPI000D0748F4|nr:hypothetical protein [Marinilabilia salmonicolor]PRY98200.1 hypothetical protein BY457_11012 [Marinilabilia salmonicolor]